MACLNIGCLLEEENLYDMGMVLKDLPNFLGKSFSEIEGLFQEYSIVSFDEVSSYIALESRQMKETRYGASVNEIIQNRKRDYEYFCRGIEILSKKGICYMELFSYLRDLGQSRMNLKEGYEKLLYEMGIFHFGSVIKGRDINSMLIVFSRVLDQFSEKLKLVNDFTTYHVQTIDDFAWNYGKERCLFPSTDLVVSDDDMLDDNTSFRSRRLSREKSW